MGRDGRPDLRKEIEDETSRVRDRFALLCLALCSGSAFAIVGFRGSTWGDLREELPKDGDSNLLLQGWIKQGVDWAKWGNVTLNTYATLRYQADTEGATTGTTRSAPASGSRSRRTRRRGSPRSVGVEYIWDRYFEADRSDKKVVIYLGWYGWWDLKR